LRRAISLAVALVLWTGVAAAVEREPAPALGPYSVLERIVPDSARFDQEIQAGNAIAMTMTNYGFYGNNFFRREASFEYPASRGYEHLVRGGLWVGAQATDDVGEFTGVACAAVDASQGPNSTLASEFTPAGLDILKRSTLSTSPFYDPLRAISELDFVSSFNDFSPVVVAGGEPHRPMKIEVQHETYQWNFAEFQNILFVHLKLTNRGPLLKNVWVGFYAELASGCKKCYVNWAPSASDAGGMGGYYDKKWIAFDDSLGLLREHYCADFAAPPDDPVSGCNAHIVPYWVGIKHLGTRGLAEDATTRKLSFSTWSWNPGSPFRDEDVERYALMSTGIIQQIAGDSLMPRTGDPVTIFSAGPFPLIYRDSTVSVDFAFVGGSGGVGGADPRDLQLNAKFAQFAYDHNYVLPVPPPSPRFEVVAREQALDFYWDDESQSAYDVTSQPPNDFQGYRVYIGEHPDTMAMVAQFDAANDTASFNTGFEAITLTPPVLVDTLMARYKFTVKGLRDGFKYYCAVTAFDIGNNQIRPLESGKSQNQRIAVPGTQPGERPGSNPTVFPNPYRVEARWDQRANVRDHYLWFANLPERCVIRIYTLAGDLLLEKEFDGATYHGEGTRGIYDPSTLLGKPTLSGASFGWDLITRQGQAIASGLYLYSVEDRVSGSKRHVGKFLVIKSDREGE
jgi:hypothetical protein